MRSGRSDRCFNISDRCGNAPSEDLPRQQGRIPARRGSSRSRSSTTPISPGRLAGRPLFLFVVAFLTSSYSLCHADFAVQVGAFRSPLLAAERNASINRLGFPAILEPNHGSGKPIEIQLLVGPYEAADDAQAAKAELAANGIDGFVRLYRTANHADQADVLTRAMLADGNAEVKNPQGQAAPPSETENVPSGLWFRRVAAATAAEPAATATKDNFLPFSISGHAQTAVAYTVASPDHWSKIKNTLHLAVERALSADINLKVSGRFSYDGAYDVSHFYPDRVRRDQRFDAMFHETYLDVGLNDWNLRLGRQNIVWGEVVGLFFADVVTAKDLRESIIPEFDYIRIPQWAGRVEYFKGDFKVEAAWIPYMTYDQIGKPGSDFYPFRIPPVPGARQTIHSERTPRSLRDSSFGLRTSYLTNGWDLAAFYYGSMDSTATFFRSIAPAAVPRIRYQPDHERIHQAGLTMSKDVGSFVLKGEAIYTWDRFFNVTRVNDSNGVVRQSFLDYILSAEISLPMDSRLNFQFFQRIFTNHDSDIIPRQVESGASMLASTKLLNDKVEPVLLVIQSLNRLDWMARFKVSWHFARDWRWVAGTAIFGGKKLGLFGRFDQQDRVFTELRYTF